jgi:hypothetical protein
VEPGRERVDARPQVASRDRAQTRFDHGHRRIGSGWE